MTFMKKRDGFTLVELLVVIGVAGVLLAIGGTLATKFVARHSTDNVTRTISSTLQLMKLKAAREGVEYQAILTFDSSKNTLTIVTQKGNSNRGSTNYTDEASQIINLSDSKVTINPANKTYNFNPDGTLGGASGTVNINPADGAGGKRCGKVVVSPFGRISVVEGTWKSSSSSCSPVY
jgi:prepilin-type N-terminal cleavage/methylation domain-containing protein